MVIYEVNIDMEADVEADYTAFMEKHIGDMLAFDGFESADWYRLESGCAPGRSCWSIHYHVTSMGALQDYFDHHAERMRSHGIRRFGKRFIATRRILTPHRHIDTGSS